jgi:hypothetical protein
MPYDESTEQAELNKSAENGTNGHATPPSDDKVIVLNFGDAFEVTIVEGTIKNSETGATYRISQTDPTADAQSAVVKGLGKIIFPTANGTLTPEALAGKATENGQAPVQYKSHRERIRARIMAREAERQESIRIHGDPVERLANLLTYHEGYANDTLQGEGEETN